MHLPLNEYALPVLPECSWKKNIMVGSVKKLNWLSLKTMQMNSSNIVILHRKLKTTCSCFHCWREKMVNQCSFPCVKMSHLDPALEEPPSNRCCLTGVWQLMWNMSVTLIWFLKTCVYHCKLSSLPWPKDVLNSYTQKLFVSSRLKFQFLCFLEPKGAGKQNLILLEEF